MPAALKPRSGRGHVPTLSTKSPPKHEEALLAKEHVNKLLANPTLLGYFRQNKTGKPITAKDIENVIAHLGGSKRPHIELSREEIKKLLRRNPTAPVTVRASA